MKVMTKQYEVFDIEDLKKDAELCDRIYQKFWIDDPHNINTWADKNIDSFKDFAVTLNMTFDCSLSNSEYPDRGCYIKLDASNYDYVAPSQRQNYIADRLKNYSSNHEYICENLRIYANKLLGEWHKGYSITKFCEDMERRMWHLWFEDNRYYFSKENFLETVEANGYEFYEDDGDFHFL